MNKEAIRKKERAKYDKRYFENVYWIEDFPNKEHYREFHYDDPTHEKRFRFLTNLLIKYFNFKTFLDAGCGTGLMIRNLLTKGYDCKGVDISEDALTYYLSDLVDKKRVFLAGLENIPFKNNEFDLVFCSDVMEHIPSFDITDSISELTRAAKNYLVLTINLDHPNEYHPTMYPRGEWKELFLEQGNLKHSKNLQNKIEKECKREYKEYDFFIFQKKQKN